MGQVWAVVVARVGNGAKSRLAVALSSPDRRRLALAMLSDVLDVCAGARDLLAGVVAVVDPAARQLAEQAAALVVVDSESGNMNVAASAGVNAARERGAGTVIILPGDVPLITQRDLAELLMTAAAAQRAVVVGASRDGQGTNALLLRPPDVIAPAFGPPSVGRHLAAGLASGALTRNEKDLGLALDVDTPDDLAALVHQPVGPRTAEALTELWLVRT